MILGGMQRPAAESPGLRLINMSTAYRDSQLVYVATKLGVADALTDGPRSAADIARAVGASSEALERVLRGLYLLGVFDQLEDGRFAQTDASELLTARATAGVREAVILWGQEQFRAWADLLKTVTTGEPAFRQLFGDPFDYYDHQRETGELFDAFMEAGARQLAGIILNCDLPDRGTIVDIAGGEGRALATILQALPHARGLLLERPPVAEKARVILRAEGVIDRAVVVAGDCRESAPRGGDVYVLMRVLHDWDDRSAGAIISAIGRAMQPASRLLVVQRLMPERLTRDPLHALVVDSDLMQMVYNGGRERTLEEYRELMHSAGLVIHQSMNFFGGMSVIEARLAL